MKHEIQGINWVQWRLYYLEENFSIKFSICCLEMTRGAMQFGDCTDGLCVWIIKLWRKAKFSWFLLAWCGSTVPGNNGLPLVKKCNQHLTNTLTWAVHLAGFAISSWANHCGIKEASGPLVSFVPLLWWALTDLWCNLPFFVLFLDYVVGTTEVLAAAEHSGGTAWHHLILQDLFSASVEGPFRCPPFGRTVWSLPECWAVLASHWV